MFCFHHLAAMYLVGQVTGSADTCAHDTVSDTKVPSQYKEPGLKSGTTINQLCEWAVAPTDWDNHTKWGLNHATSTLQAKVWLSLHNSFPMSNQIILARHEVQWQGWHTNNILRAFPSSYELKSRYGGLVIMLIFLWWSYWSHAQAWPESQQEALPRQTSGSGSQ